MKTIKYHIDWIHLDTINFLYPTTSYKKKHGTNSQKDKFSKKDEEIEGYWCVFCESVFLSNSEQEDKSTMNKNVVLRTLPWSNRWMHQPTSHELWIYFPVLSLQLMDIFHIFRFPPFSSQFSLGFAKKLEKSQSVQSTYE